MGVDSAFEMYTLLWGWHQYGAIWDVLKETGLAFVPFMGMILNTYLQTVQSQDPGDASTASLAGVEVQFLTAIFIILVAVQPSVSVNMEDVEFVKICFDGHSQLDKTYKINNDKPQSEKQTGYDQFDMTGFNVVKIPPWWYGVLSFSNGLVRASQKSLPCIEDIRVATTNISSYSLTDQKLLSYIKGFVTDCYLPTKAQFDKDEKAGVNKLISSRREIIEKWMHFTSEHDIHWIGSRIFRSLDRYYTDVFPKDGTQMAGLINDVKGSLGAITVPTCLELWETSQVGLEARLHKEVLGRFPEDTELFIGRYKTKAKGFFEALKDNLDPFAQPTQGELDMLGRDEVLRRIISGNVAYRSVSEAGQVSGATHTYSQVASDGGRKLQWLSHYTMVDSMVKVLPVIGSLMLLSLYVFLPLGLVFSSYSLQFVIIASVGIFSVKFYFYLWHVAWWMDQNLVETMVLDPLNDNTQKHVEIIDMVSSMLYVGLPMLWTLMVTWAGISLNRYLGATVQSAGEPLYSATQKAASWVQQKATGAAIGGLSNSVSSGIKDGRLQAMEEKIKDAQQDAEHIASDLHQMTQDLSDAEQELENANQELEQSKQDNENLSNDLNVALDDLTRANEQIDKVQDQIVSGNAEIDYLSKELQAKHGELNNLIKEIRALEAKQSQTEADLEEHQIFVKSEPPK